MGVGDATASPAAATIAWLLRSVSGTVGHVAFAAGFGTDLDARPKQWRLLADALNDAAALTELLAPALPPGAFVALACAASTMRAIVGVAGGATRAALLQHQAKRDNLADISAKDASQETLVGIAALAAGMALLRVLSAADPAYRLLATWLIFLVLVLLHMGANYRAVCAVHLATLNRERASICARSFLQHNRVPTPDEAATCERVCRIWYNPMPATVLGASISAMLATAKMDDVARYAPMPPSFANGGRASDAPARRCHRRYQRTLSCGTGKCRCRCHVHTAADT